MNTIEHLEFAEHGFAFNTATGDHFMMNETARTILREFRAGNSESDVVDILARDYGVPPRDLKRDVADFCTRLRCVGLV